MADSIWAEAVVAAFQNYCAQQTYSYAEIAAKLSDQFGIALTRNACIGKAGRMGIVAPHRNDHPLGRAKRAVAKARTRNPRVVKTGNNHYAVRKLETIEYKLRAIEIECTVPFADVTGCWYPAPPNELPYLFCDGKRRDGSSFCETHHHVVWVAPRSRRDGYIVQAAAS